MCERVPVFWYVPPSCRFFTAYHVRMYEDIFSTQYAVRLYHSTNTTSKHFPFAIPIRRAPWLPLVLDLKLPASKTIQRRPPNRSLRTAYVLIGSTVAKLAREREREREKD